MADDSVVKPFFKNGMSEIDEMNGFAGTVARLLHNCCNVVPWVMQQVFTALLVTAQQNNRQAQRIKSSFSSNNNIGPLGQAL
jgi:hypothetical protein